MEHALYGKTTEQQAMWHYFDPMGEFDFARQRHQETLSVAEQDRLVKSLRSPQTVGWVHFSGEDFAKPEQATVSRRSPAALHGVAASPVDRRPIRRSRSVAKTHAESTRRS
jgi:hypothetical protein